MSKEWLAQLSSMAAQQGRNRPRHSPASQAPRPQAPPAPTVKRAPELPERGFVGAIIGSIIRWAILSALAGGLFIFIVIGDEFSGASLGERVLFGIWYLATILVEFGFAVDPDAIYGALQAHVNLVPFLAPLAIGAAITLLFLPTVNAYRRRAGLRFFIFLLNLLLLYVAWSSEWIVIDLTGRNGWLDAQTVTNKAIIAWAALLAISFLRIQRVRAALPTPAPKRQVITPYRVSARAAMSSSAIAASRSSDAAALMARRGGSVVERTVNGGSWRRPR
ncbi:MAG TPA: hypothetical protein VH835_08515 [Dongiaceae bacterium]|jgi:hypothetical protein